jgi:hypothetical protein
MIRRILLLSAISLAAVSAADKASKFEVTLYQTTVVNGTAFKAGDAKVELADGKAVLRQGKLTAEIPVKVEMAKDKYAQTRVGYREHQITDISVGGTNKHILFPEAVGGQ